MTAFPAPRPHRWDEIRSTPTSITRRFLEEMGLESIGHGLHESLLRSYRVVEQVKDMLDRGDSAETIREFIAWVEDPLARADAHEHEREPR